MTTIEIYRVDDKYGILSNNFKSYTNIDGETWNSISNYIYTKALPSIMYRDKMKRANPIKIHDDFNYYRIKLEEDVLSVALLEALRVKFQNPKIMDILLSTGNSPIIYKSINDFLGDGKDGNGKNMLGNYMVQIRDEVLNQKKRERELAEREELIYKAYLARYTLQDAFNKDDDLKEYFDLSFDEIVNKYGLQKFTEYSQKNYLNYLPTKSTILQFYRDSSDEDKKFINQAILYPNILIFKIRKDLQNLATRKEKVLKNKVFDMYVQDLIKKKFPLLSKEKQEMYKNKMISNQTYEQFEATKNKVYDNLLQNKNSLQEEVKTLTLEANIPSKEEIKSAENINIEDIFFLEQKKQEKDIKLETISPVLELEKEEEEEDIPFNPLDFGEYSVKKPSKNKNKIKSEFMEEIVDSSSSDDGASDDEDDDESYEKKYKKGSEAEKKLGKAYQEQLEFEKKKVEKIKPTKEIATLDINKLSDKDYKIVQNIIMKSDPAFNLWMIENEKKKEKKENKDEVEQKRKLDEYTKQQVEIQLREERRVYNQNEKEAKEKYRSILKNTKKEDGSPYYSDEDINRRVIKYKYIPDKSQFTLTKAIQEILDFRKEQMVPDLRKYEFNIPIELINVGEPVLIFAGTPPLNYVIEYKDNLQLLSPIYYTGMVIIKNLEYPTICHYLYTTLFSLEYEVNTMRDAYNYILNYPLDVYNNLFGGKSNPPSKFLPYNFLAEYLKYIRSVKNAEKFGKLTKEALDMKFINMEYQDVLLSTGNVNIIYNDRRDSYLGTKEITTYNINRKGYTSTEHFILATRRIAFVNKGLNFVGKYLMCLREQIINNRKDLTPITGNDFDKLYLFGSLKNEKWSDSEIDDICKKFSEFKNGSLFIKEWVNSKTDDMCKTLLKFNQYYKKKYVTTINFDSDIGIKIIIENIYMKAKEILNLVSNVDTKKIPIIYRDRLQSNYKNRFYVYDGIFWSNIFSNILFLLNNIRNLTFYDAEKILYKSNKIISDSNPCLRIVPTALNNLNCIVGAILNILLKIQKIYKEGVIEQKSILSRKENIIDFILEKVDIELAVSIILNTKNLVTIDFKLQDEKLLYENIKDIMVGEEEGEDEDRPIVHEEVEAAEYEEEEIMGVQTGKEIVTEIGEEKGTEFEFQDEYLRDSDDEIDIDDEAKSELGDYDVNQYDDEDEDDYGDNFDGANDLYKSKKGKGVKKFNKKKPVKDEEKNINLDIHTKELAAYIIKYNLFGISVSELICKLILNGAIFILNYKTISIQTKRNRYNFFSGN